MDLADENRKDGETILNRPSPGLYADPNNRDLVSAEKRMHRARVAKAMGAG